MVKTDAIISAIINKTDEYLKIPSVVGHERPFLDHLYKEYKGLGYKAVREDNIVAVSGDDPSSHYISAHIDRHGILSIGGGDYRYAAHAIKNYKYDEETASEKLSHLEGVCDQFKKEPVYAYGRWSGDVIAKGHVELCHYCTKRSNLIFKIDGMEEMPEGIPVSYMPECLEKDGYIEGQLDNVLSVGLIYGLFKAGFQGTAIFTAEEEIGKSWKHLSGFLNSRNIETDSLIILDTSPYDTSAYADEGKIALRNRDSFGAFNPDVVNALKSACDTHGLAYDIKDETLIAEGRKEDQIGRTELGRLVHEHKERWNGATVQTPTFHYHTNHESTTRLAIGNVLQLLNEYCGMNKMSNAERKRA